MKIFITGGLGFVGRHLSSALLDDGHRVTAVGRTRDPKGRIEHPAFSYISADTTEQGDWQEKAAEHDVIVNLAGKSIFTLWTTSAKKQIYESRIETTRNLARCLEGASGKVLVSTSAVGFYGDRGEEELTEKADPGDDFLADLSQDWEREANEARSEGVRVVLTRFGIVLDRDGGAMASMIPAFKFFLGGRLGSGRQWFPWIHLQDLIAAQRFVIERDGIAGPVNFTAPHPVRNRELTAVLADKLNRPVTLPAPSPLLKIVLGEFGEVLLSSQRARPTVLQEAGFSFNYPDIDSALDEITGG